MNLAYGFTIWKTSHPSTFNCCLTGWSFVEYITFCFGVWWISYFFLLLISRQSNEWNCRFLTFLHGSIVSLSALRDIYMNLDSTDLQVTPLSEEQKGYLSIMLSYFVFDFLWIHLYGNEPWVIHFHHISSIFIIIKIIFSDLGGLGVSFGVAGLEFTNPYLQARWFLRTYGYLNKPIHTAVELWFFFLFFLIRVLGGTILFCYVDFFSDVDIVFKFLFACIYFVSMTLAWDICKYIRKKYWGNRRYTSFLHAYNRRENTELQEQNAVPGITNATVSKAEIAPPASKDEEEASPSKTDSIQEAERDNEE